MSCEANLRDPRGGGDYYAFKANGNDLASITLKRGSLCGTKIWGVNNPHQEIGEIIISCFCPTAQFSPYFTTSISNYKRFFNRSFLIGFSIPWISVLLFFIFGQKFPFFIIIGFISAFVMIFSCYIYNYLCPRCNGLEICSIRNFQDNKYLGRAEY
eukprot:TRINITY_DN9527_c0_g2_i3.p1 TRINITY_DN9527_c0_g2~~TRINITY_DN9527_c0_g2_i3.p1  ORF type:complete len:156 (+),score=5.80 TRINITY_DN9527_c0_g2_i3:440-907(+)